MEFRRLAQNRRKRIKTFAQRISTVGYYEEKFRLADSSRKIVGKKYREQFVLPPRD